MDSCLDFMISSNYHGFTSDQPTAANLDPSLHLERGS